MYIKHVFQSIPIKMACYPMILVHFTMFLKYLEGLLYTYLKFQRNPP